MDSYEVKGCQIIWAIKDHAISHTFFDEGAAAFFLPQLASSEKETAKSSDSGKAEAVVEVSPFKRTKYALEQSPVKNLINEDARCGAEAETMGVALGPDWHSGLEMTGKESQEVRIVPYFFITVVGHSHCGSLGLWASEWVCNSAAVKAKLIKINVD